MISVVMPSYNQVEYIERSIQSILDQAYPFLDLIIIDGGSTDGTVDVIRKHERHISYWVSEPDRGQSDALNKGFAGARGEIFGWLNSDDLYLPGAIQRAVETLVAHPEKGIVHGDWLTIDERDNVLSREYSFDFNLSHFKYEGFQVNAQAMFWRREVHERFGGFDVRLHRTMDYQMIVAFGINEGSDAFLRIPEPLGCFRRHTAQKTQGLSDAVRDEHRLIAVRYGFGDKYGGLGSVKRLFYRARRARWYLKRGGARYFLAKSAEAMIPTRDVH